MARFQIIQDGQPVPFSCQNSRFRTNISKGKPHSPSSTLGSVLDNPLVANGSYTLWLEHVIDIGSGDECFWLMWYDNGVPKIPLRGVFDRDQFAKMVAQLPSFIP